MRPARQHGVEQRQGLRPTAVADLLERRPSLPEVERGEDGPVAGKLVRCERDLPNEGLVR